MAHEVDVAPQHIPEQVIMSCHAEECVDNRQEMISSLLRGVGELEVFHDDPEEVAPQFMSWVANVGDTLAVACLTSDAEAWSRAAARIEFTPHSSSFVAHIKSMKALLLAIFHRIGGVQPEGELLDTTITHELPSYIQRVAAQADGAYQYGWYDASAVMLRKLVESVIIECFESANLESSIKDQAGNYRRLGELVDAFKNETSWNTSRNVRVALPRLSAIKELGDLAAHSRRFVATKQDLSKFIKDLRLVVQELAYIATQNRANLTRQRDGGLTSP
jgi:hypothetical protein